MRVVFPFRCFCSAFISFISAATVNPWNQSLKNVSRTLSTYLVAVSSQVVEDVTTCFSHVHFTPIYHLLIDVQTLLRSILIISLKDDFSEQ